MPDAPPSDRNASDAILPVIVDRWSPRSFDGSALPLEDLKLILEAAGLAPSAFNVQPWTFLYALPGDANWDAFLGALIPFNQSWAEKAGALIFIVSQKMQGEGDDAKPNHSHSFDCGTAWGYMALQATAMGYHAHGMTGIDFDKANDVLNIPDSHRLEAAVAIGTRADADLLPEGMRKKEMISGRKPVEEKMRAGPFA